MSRSTAFFDELEELNDLVSDGPEVGASALFAGQINAIVARLAAIPATAADVDDEFTEDDDSETEH